MRRWLVIALALALPGCEGRAVGDGPCVRACEEIRDKLIDNFGIPPDKVDCSDPVWLEADTCDKCERLIGQLYQVGTTGLCHHFD